jgi:hypothetical protein
MEGVECAEATREMRIITPFRSDVRRDAPISVRFCGLLRLGSTSDVNRVHESRGNRNLNCESVASAAGAGAGQPFGSSVQGCLPHEQVVDVLEIGGAEDSRYLGWAVTSGFCDILLLSEGFPKTASKIAWWRRRCRG